ncbi:hypothetical protein BKA67DRAFT_531901 [Truncatella angustata]|uniref:Uncharacterized protein n=1 Tax=Truncatella angustata TaxID=152316 RepID=A0A9P8URD2_9PEZI|nr:uncharacterized protein BKA67DRAFT_531901 [Truncatella angustata]KAH6656640.1 hypothetical protein BKA67DRAFT_531901 [Truncatella angustata]KAH8199265.1 hypothetical protein TruAng_006548 [Truncatella angustata]
MLTLKQPVHYGYRTVYDLPTPPSTSRPSPPVTIQEIPQNVLPPPPARNSPSCQEMSAPHRGLPLPAAMTLPQPNPPPPGHAPGPGHGPVPVSHPHPHAQPPPPSLPPSQSHSLGILPAAPQWQGQGAEESMRTWLVAKTEEERRRQEEEKTRQEGLRLEQRKLEYDMLRTSLDRGIPPPMVPVVFAGMSGGILPQAALEWAQQYLTPQHGHQQQLLPAQGPFSPEDRRGSQSYGPYAGSVGVPSTPGSGPGPQSGFVPYQGPGSPTRARAHTMSVAGAVGRPLGSSLPRLATGEMITGPAGIQSHTQTMGQHQQSSSQQETQSPSIYFHHWQPPTSQAVSAQPGTPSVDSPKKRKATGPQQAAPPPSTHMSRRSPPFGHSAGSSTLSNPPPGRRRGHSRQRSDLSSYRSTGRGRGDSFGPSRALSPGLGTPREGVPFEQSIQGRTNAHSVSSLLSSDQPSPRFGPERGGHEGSERRPSPPSSDERRRGPARLERDNE